MNYIIGTAGHIDHGKTNLIYGLTGENTDRLEEEKNRGISVDLGFAPLQLSGGGIAGIVDVPGHEKFVHNMLAGAAGVDMVLLVIDVTEGIMPQTKEHLAIMELLEVNSGIIVLTKIDLEDKEWVDMMEMEVREELENTFLADKPLAKVSNQTGEGLEELKNLIEIELENATSKNVDGPLRIPIDRVFKIQGFGTVITGTMASGTLEENEEVELVPGNIKTRIRKIQVYKNEVKKAEAGQRVALNLSGVDREDIFRGTVVGRPGFYEAVSHMDVRLKLLDNIDWTLKNGSPLHLHLGTGETVARTYFYENKKLAPGESALCQLRLEKPLVAYRKDKFIIRSYSPVTTIGGGYIIEHKTKKHKLKDKKVIERLKSLEKGNPKDIIMEIVLARAPITDNDLYKQSGLGENDFEKTFNELIDNKSMIKLNDYLIDKGLYEKLKELVKEKLKEYHDKYPLRKGRAKAELMGVVSKLPQRAYQAFLETLQKEENIIEIEEDYVRLKDFKPAISEEDENKMKQIEELLEKELFKPPNKKQLLEELSDLGIDIEQKKLDEYLEFLKKNDRVVKTSEDLFYSKKAFDEAKNILKKYFEANDTLSIGTWRDLLGTTRRYAIPILEKFDQEKLVKRDGDVRLPWMIKKVK
ncbi:selenocysteine-specific translation elongation factor [Natranaerofaba carboxydovora]|uniref:selenocysteine-specific translation elongation factor n=1 Tax=Natranaerofaba carboxydovora TaxID=2742683 RepID=UPI001F1293D0|nr:selenocysteine-specific translation elongation factor [Natranaerofaba carboxydovora]UMZ72892.1 Selenocysteine-specific elongation factor [Natranaerofaba carboxydovora]